MIWKEFESVKFRLSFIPRLDVNEKIDLSVISFCSYTHTQNSNENITDIYSIHFVRMRYQELLSCLPTDTHHNCLRNETIFPMDLLLFQVYSRVTLGFYICLPFSMCAKHMMQRLQNNSQFELYSNTQFKHIKFIET